MSTASISAPRVDLYTRGTNRIVEQLERGVRPWIQPWNAEHAAGRITRPLRHNGQPYKGISLYVLPSLVFAICFASIPGEGQAQFFFSVSIPKSMGGGMRLAATGGTEKWWPHSWPAG